MNKIELIKALLESYFLNDYAITDIRFENQGGKSAFSFNATLKNGHAKEVMFYSSVINVTNIHFDRMSFEASILEEDLVEVEKDVNSVVGKKSN